MTTCGVIGIANEDLMLAYLDKNAEPQKAGISLLQELKKANIETKIGYYATSLWDLVGINENDQPSKELIETIKRITKNRTPDNPRTVHDLYRPLQGTLRPYLQTLIYKFPDGSTHVKKENHCKWAYILNLDKAHFDILHGPEVIAAYKAYYGHQGSHNTLPFDSAISYDARRLPSSKRFLQDLSRLLQTKKQNTPTDKIA